jgi:[ribosomal protein S5]-alanine N-acetyltransferase
VPYLYYLFLNKYFMSGPSKSILGEVTALTITSPDLESSLKYYQKLGFSEVMRADWPFPWIQVSDGVLLIMLRKDADPYIALTYYARDVDKVAASLAKKGIAFAHKPKKTDMIRRYLIQSPDNLNISLVGIVDGFSQPPGPGMLAMPPEEYFKPEKYVNKTCGLFGELAHPVADLERSLAFWELLGFTAISRFSAPYPWAIISDGLSVVGLHEATHFAYPAITYFAADMDEKINALKAAGITGFKQQGASGVGLTTPEQQHIFLFSLGMPQVPEKKALDIQLPVIETRRLLLRQLDPGSMEVIYATCSDEEAMKLLGIATAEQLAMERNNFQQGMTTYRTSFRRFILVEKESGKAIGRGGFHNWYSEHNRAELGYRIDEESAKRKGLMTEAVEAIIRHGFKDMGLNRIEAFVGSRNEASLKIVKNSGFTAEGTLRSHYNNNGIMEDSVCFSLLRSEYKEN